MVRGQVPSLPVQGLSGWSKCTQIILTFILTYFHNLLAIDILTIIMNVLLSLFFFFFNTHFYIFRAEEAVREDVRVLASADDMSRVG